METRCGRKLKRLQRSSTESRPADLPEEIIEEIFSRLSVKSLLRFRCVSKSYRSLIDSKRFIKSHHQKSTNDSSLAHHKVLLSYSNTRIAKGCSLLSFLDGSDSKNASKMNLPATVPLYCKIMFVVGSCNGLVCLLSRIYFDDGSQFILWNPSTRVSKQLPHIDENNISWYNYNYVGFGWDESSDDYKVIAVYTKKKKTMRRIYNLKTDSWKEIHACNIDNMRRSFKMVGVLARGKLYWNHEREIIAFDLKREVFENVEQPCYSKGGFALHLGRFGGCLAVGCSYKGYKVIWAMKEECWVKVMVVYAYDEFGVWISPCVQACYKAAKREIVLMNMNHNGRKHLAYDLKNGKFFYGPYIEESDIYVESLVSPFV